MTAPLSSSSTAPRLASSSFNRRASARSSSRIFGIGMIKIGRIAVPVNPRVERQIAAR